MTIKVVSAVDTQTGEKIYEGEDMAFYLFNSQGFKLLNNHSCVRVWQKTKWSIAPQDKAKLLELIPRLNRHNQLMREDRPSHPLTVPLLAPLIGISENRAYSWMKRMIAADVVRKDEGIFYVNPLYMMAGIRVSVDMYRVWRDLLDPKMPAYVREKYKEWMRE